MSNVTHFKFCCPYRCILCLLLDRVFFPFFQSIDSSFDGVRVCGWLFVVVPHITDAIQEWVERVAKVPVDGDSHEPDVCIIEVIYIVPLSLFDFIELVSLQ